VERGALAPVRLLVRVVVLEHDLVDVTADRLPDLRRRPAARALLLVQLAHQLGKLARHAEAQHEAQVVPVHVNLLERRKAAPAGAARTGRT
jgi:hypothetical protein